MRMLVFVGLLFCSEVAGSQSYFDVGSMGRNGLHIPAAQTGSSASIAAYIQANSKTDDEKVAAIYSWVINNIRYDADSMYPINWGLEQAEKVSATLRRRKGVCENYATLFTDIAVKTGFPSFVVTGYTRDQTSVNRSGHSWSAIRLHDRWFLCDPTWDISNDNLRWFLVSPEEFIGSHIPFDPLWQLLENPVSEHEFSNGVFHAKKNNVLFNYNDSAANFLQLDSLQQLEAAARRIRQAGIDNDRQQHWLAYNQMKIAGIYGEQDMNLYNGAVADLNKASAVFNNFVQYRNNRFQPLKSDAETAALLTPIKHLLLSAEKKIDTMGKAVENFQYDTGPLKERMEKLGKRVEEQQQFLKQYLAADSTHRPQLFYN